MGAPRLVAFGWELPNFLFQIQLLPSHAGHFVTALRERFRHRRRRAVKRYGKRLVRRMGGFLAAQSKVGNPPIFDTRTFPAIQALDDNAAVIRREVDAVLERMESIPRLQDISTDQSRISAGDDWRSFFYYGLSYPAPLNCALCPETAKLLRAVSSWACSTSNNAAMTFVSGRVEPSVAVTPRSVGIRRARRTGAGCRLRAVMSRRR